jgi:hypothetical protein
VATARSDELRAVAKRVAAALPASVTDVVLTGSTSRGVADADSDVELLVVSDDPPRDVPLTDVRRWSPGLAGANWVGGMHDGEFVELVWWAPAYADERVRAIVAGEIVDHARLRTAEAIVSGAPLRGERHAAWRAQLAVYPDGLSEKIVDDAWAGFDETAAQIRSVTRPGDGLALASKTTAYAEDVLRIVFAVNRQWEPGWKRLAQRVEPLAAKPERLAERLDAAVRAFDLPALRELAVEARALA